MNISPQNDQNLSASEQFWSMMGVLDSDRRGRLAPAMLAATGYLKYCLREELLEKYGNKNCLSRPERENMASLNFTAIY